MLRFLLTATLMLIVLSACSWVKLTEDGKTVSVVDAGQVQGCDRIAEIRTQVRDRVAAVQRKPGKVAEELERLARNEAAALGGNRIVEQGPVTDGRRGFAVFSCPE